MLLSGDLTSVIETPINYLAPAFHSQLSPHEHAESKRGR